MRRDIERILISEEEIQQKVSEMGKKISDDFRDKDPLFVGC